MTERIIDAIECFHQINNELMGDADKSGEQAKWTEGEQSRRWHARTTDLLQPSDSVAQKN